MQVILPIQQWRHFRQYRVNQLAERDTQGHQRISKDTKRTPKVRNFIFKNKVPTLVRLWSARMVAEVTYSAATHEYEPSLGL